MVNVEIPLPGETLLPGKPWLRREGNTVIRFVRIPIERNALRHLHEKGVRKPSLDSVKNLLEVELTDLKEEFDIDVVPSQIEVDVIPRFFGPKDKPMTQGMGIKITSDYVSGTSVTGAEQVLESDREAAGMAYTELADKIEEYMEARHMEGRSFLRDIFRAEQFVLSDSSEGGITLVDVDPVFAIPTEVSLESSRMYAQRLGSLISSSESFG